MFLEADSKTSPKYTEKVVDNLIKLGYSRVQVVEALDSNDGDENRAKITLFAKSLTFPKK